MRRPIERVVFLGGVTQLEWLDLVKADVLDRQVVLPLVPERAAVGAAILAGVSVGSFTSAEEGVSTCAYEQRIIKPDTSRLGWYERVSQRACLPLYSVLK